MHKGRMIRPFIKGQVKEFVVPDEYKDTAEYCIVCTDGNRAFYYDKEYRLLCEVKRNPRKTRFWNGNEWSEIEPEINAYMKPIYKLDVHDDGRQFLLEIDCSSILRDKFGGDVEKFKAAIKCIKVG